MRRPHCILAASDAQAQRTVKIVVPYPPGSGPDILSRMMADQIGRMKDGPTIVVENRPGGGTVIGNEAVARAAPDGNTVLLAASPLPSARRCIAAPTTW